MKAPKSTVVTGELPTVKIDGKTYTLTPTLAAARRITLALGGLRPAFFKVADLDPDAAAAVIAAGAGLEFEDQDAADKFSSDLLFNTPRDDYQPGMGRFLEIMLVGGKKPDPVEEKASTDSAEKKADAGNV